MPGKTSEVYTQMSHPNHGSFPTAGNAFRINNQELTQYPITLVIHDSSYATFTAAGEAVFKNQYPYAYLGTSPWLASPTNDVPLAFSHPVNSQIIDLLLCQGEYGVVVYALSENTLKQPGTASVLEHIKKRCPHAQHLLLKLMDTDKGSCKDAIAAGSGLQLAAYASEESARKLFVQLKQDISQMKAPVYYDKLNREPAEWTNFSLAEPLHEKENRVLIVGDSISAGYGKFVRELLPGCQVDSLNTSEGTHHPNFYRLLQIALTQYPYKVVHLNNGIHIHGISTKEYRQNLTSIFQWIHIVAPDTQIIFANTTSASRRQSIPDGDAFQSKHFQLGDRVPLDSASGNLSEYRYSPDDSALYMELNHIASQVCGHFCIPVNDLFTLCVSEDLPKSDYVHFQTKGYKRLAQAVADSISKFIS